MALSGDLDDVVAARETLDTRRVARGVDFSAAAARAAPPKTGADAGSRDVDYSGDVDEDRSAGQDAAADQGLSA